MTILTANIKPYLKTLNTVKAEFVVFNTETGYVSADETNVSVKVTSENLLNPSKDTYILPLDTFTAFVSKAGESITFTKTENGCKLLSGSLSVTVPEGRFQPKPVLEEFTSSVPAGLLKEAVIYGSAVTNAKELLGYASVIRLQAVAELFEEDATKVSVMSTDGQRCTLLDMEATVKPFDVFLPSSLVPVIVSFTGDTVHIMDTENYVLLKCGDITAKANKFTTEYPDVRAVFNQVPKYAAKFDHARLAKTVDDVRPFLRADTPDVSLLFGRVLSITTPTANVELSYEGEAKDLEFTAPHRFLADFLVRTKEPVMLTTDGSGRIMLESGVRKYLFVTKVTK